MPCTLTEAISQQYKSKRCIFRILLKLCHYFYYSGYNWNVGPIVHQDHCSVSSPNKMRFYFLRKMLSEYLVGWNTKQTRQSNLSEKKFTATFLILLWKENWIISPFVKFLSDTYQNGLHPGPWDIDQKPRAPCPRGWFRVR